MILLIPVGRGTGVIKPPYATLALIALTTFVYLNTWPAQKKYVYSRIPNAPLNSAARQLAAIATDPSFDISAPLKTGIDKEKSSLIFPTDEADRLYAQVDTEVSVKSFETRGRWQSAYDVYIKIKKSLLQKDVPDRSLFAQYGFDASREYFPGLLTHMFLHAGFFHLLFNMLFLWIVGTAIEERWGPALFLLIYFSGGIAAALAQEWMHSLPGVGLVGASGAVAAIMGAFLIRHFKMPIRMFYFFFLIFRMKTGFFMAPAWTMLILWLGEQIFWATMTAHAKNPGVGYGAHIGGFAYGAAAGLMVLKAGVASTWEKKAETTKGGIEERAKEAAKLFQEGKYEQACATYEKQLLLNPTHYPTLVETLKANAFIENWNRVPTLAIRSITRALDEGRISEAAKLLEEWKFKIAKGPLTDKDVMSYAQALTTLERCQDAATWYGSLLKNYPASIFRGKAIFSTAKLLRDKLNQSALAEKWFRALTQKPFDVEWKSLAEAELAKFQP